MEVEPLKQRDRGTWARALMPVLGLSLALAACDQAEDEAEPTEPPGEIQEDGEVDIATEIEGEEPDLEGLPLVEMDADGTMKPEVIMPEDEDTGPDGQLADTASEIDALVQAAGLPSELPEESSEPPLPENTPFVVVTSAPTTTRVRALDKITARVTELDLPQDIEVRFGTLAIRARTCRSRPPEEQPETFAYLEIDDVKTNQDHEAVFAGWMMASSPALNALEHPVYDVWVIACKRNSGSASSANE